MAVSSTARKQQFTLNGTTSTLTFTFRALVAAPTDIKVVVTAGGVDTDLVYTTDFTVAVNSNGIGGTVTLVSPSSVGSGTATVYRDTTNTQESDYDNYNQFPADTVEKDFDIRTLVSQEQGEALDRTLTLPISADSGVSTELPNPSADAVIGWNAAADGLENKTLADIGAAALATQAEAEAGTNNTSYMSPLRTFQAIVAKLLVLTGVVNFAKGTDIASASTTNLASATGNFVDVTGTVTITALGTVQAGAHRKVRFTGILTLTHNATTLILPTGANITTAVGDVAEFVSLGSGNWVCVGYMRKDGSTVAGSGYPVNYRSQMYVMQASTTTLTVAPGVLEVNGSAITKTSNTTLTLSTGSNWAGGSSLTATSTTIYIGVDASGNIKMHTTAPTNADYALSVSAANNTKRYASWSSTVYRIIGWARLNTTGSGELDTYGVSNIADGGVKNEVMFQTSALATGTTTIPADDTIPQNTEGDQYMSLNFVPTNVNNQLRITVMAFVSNFNTPETCTLALFQDATAGAIDSMGFALISNGRPTTAPLIHQMKAGTTSITTFKIRIGANTGNGSTTTFNGSAGARFYGGVAGSFLRIEEIESQLT